MDENKNNINPANENNAPQGVVTIDDLANANQRIADLENELKVMTGKYETSNKYHLQYYRQTQILTTTLRSIMNIKEMKLGEVYELMLEANNMGLDELLMVLSK